MDEKLPRKDETFCVLFVEDGWSNIVEKIRKENSHKREAKDCDVDS